MKIWILAAGFLSIAPLSEGMLRLGPPPVQEQASRWRVEHERLIEVAARKQVESERAAGSDRMAVNSSREWW